jgi:UDP-glucose 4-epimerase
MKILVTGGAGFIGSHVAGQFLAAGHEVVVLDNLSSGRRENVPVGARLQEGDIRDPGLGGWLKQERFQAIDHHAAQISVPYSLENPRLDAEVNLVGLVNLLEGGVRAGVERFIYIGSGGAIYGDLEHPPAAEDQPPLPRSPYATSKLAGELYLGLYARTRGLAWVSLRYANVYGPRQIPQGEAGVVAIFMQALKEDREVAIYRPESLAGGCERDYVFVGDCARANLAALTRGEGAYNIGTGKATSTLALWQAIQAAAGRQGRHRFGPHREGDALKNALTCARAEKDLGWQPQASLDQGLAATWAWHLGRGA